MSAEVRPYVIEVPQEQVDDLRDRLRNARWPRKSPEAGWSRGVPLAYLQELAAYWADGFDWREQEAILNEIPQFVTTIDGQEVHFMHVRSPEPDALPLLMTHGWPTSPAEFSKVIGPLTDPRAYGGDPQDAFHLVIPSLPGYGFSTPVAGEGWGNLFQVAKAWAEVMTRLGYERYGAHGGDVGSGVTSLLPMVDGERVTGYHLAGTVPTMPFGPPIDLSELSGSERERAERFNTYQQEGLGYLHMQSTKPQTLAYALTDSPVGQLAWVVEKFKEWTDPKAELPEDAVDRDHLLTLVSICWFNATGASSAHATYEGMKVFREMSQHSEDDDGQAEEHAGPPRAVAVFAADTTFRSVFDPDNSVAHWTEYDRGGHFPAMEVPDLFVGDLRDFFRDNR